MHRANAVFKRKKQFVQVFKKKNKKKTETITVKIFSVFIKNEEIKLCTSIFFRNAKYFGLRRPNSQKYVT